MGAFHLAFTSCTFASNDAAVISIDPASLLSLNGNTASNSNGTNGVAIRSGTISSNVTWNQTDLTYRLMGTVTVNIGVTLTISPGVIFKGSQQQVISNWQSR
jgi:hypothetical protein